MLLQYISPTANVALPATNDVTFNVNTLPANGLFELKVGNVTTGPIVFDSTIGVDRNQHDDRAGDAGFARPIVTLTSTDNPFTFSVAFAGSEPSVQYVAATPLDATFANNKVVAAAAQKLTFTSTANPLKGIFQLQVGAVTTAGIAFRQHGA